MPSMLRASFLKSILPLTGDEARPKVGTAPRAAPRISGSVFVPGERRHQSCSPPLLSQGMLWVISTLGTPPFLFSPLGQRGWHGCPRPRGEQERAWWRLPHRMSCRCPRLRALPTLTPAWSSYSTPQSHPDTLLKIETGLQDSRTNQSPLGALQTPVFPLSPPFPVCICSICPHARLTGSPASRVCAAGDTKPVLSVPEPQQPSPGSCALPQCCLSRSCAELSALQHSPCTLGRCRHRHEGTGTP